MSRTPKAWVGRRDRGQAFIPECQRNKGRVVRQVRQHIQGQEGDQRLAEHVAGAERRAPFPVKPDITDEFPVILV